MTPTMKANLPAPTLALIVLTVMAGLYGIDKFLAAQEQSEVEQEALGDYQSGEKLLNSGKPHQAAADFSRAHVLNRGNRQYLLSLATAQIADRQFLAAHDTLDDALEEDSNDGWANLLMARLMKASGKSKDADFYYHRAIYGEWPADAAKQAAKVRLELTDMLAQDGKNRELLSELLLLQNGPDQSLETRKHLAGLFLRAGAADRAADAYRRLIREDRSDADVYIGLGQAEILLGNYRGAENAFLDALRRRMNDPRIQSQLRMVSELATLDPTLRRLSTAEKYRRSQQILDLAQGELAACQPNAAPSQPAAPVKAAAPPQPAAPTQPAAPVEAPITNEMAEAILDDAEQAWKQRLQVCSQPPAQDDPLRFLMKKLAQ